MPTSLLERHSSAAWFDAKVPLERAEGAGSVTDGVGAGDGVASGIRCSVGAGVVGDGEGDVSCANADDPPKARSADSATADINFVFI